METLAAVGAFLAQRYRDNDHGIVMNWIVGNEVNVRSDWNYMQYVDLDTYAREYANAVRVFYNSIKSMNANARVYVSMDQQWNRDLSSKNSYDVRDLLVSMNQVISTEGNIDWGLADHPYAYPLTNTTFWNSSGKIQKLITNSENTSIVTMQNINVITNFLQKEEMLTADGEVRPVILSELGYSSSQGEIIRRRHLPMPTMQQRTILISMRSFCPDRRMREKRLHRDLHWDCPLRADSINIFTRFTKISIR